MRLRSIEIRNFQSIAHAKLELEDWTSLVGTSDVGKSACLRALYALLTNQRGDHFIRHGESFCAVVVERDDGVTVDWRKGRGKSGAYILSTPAGSETFDRTAGDVPPEIRGALPLLVEIDGQPFMPGFQRQHDRPFMFGDTPRWRAQALGEFDGTNVLLLAETRLRREQRTAQAIVSAQSDRATALVAELEALDYVAELGKALEAAQAAHEARQRAEVRDAGVRTTLTLLGMVTATETSLRVPGDAASAHLTEAGDWMEEVKRLRFKIDGMTELLAPLERPLPEVPEVPDFEPVRRAFHRVDQGRALLEGLTGLAGNQAIIETELAAVTAQLAEFQTCPTCGRVLG